MFLIFYFNFSDYVKEKVCSDHRPFTFLKLIVPFTVKNQAFGSEPSEGSIIRQEFNDF